MALAIFKMHLLLLVLVHALVLSCLQSCIHASTIKCSRSLVLVRQVHLNLLAGNFYSFIFLAMKPKGTIMIMNLYLWITVAAATFLLIIVTVTVVIICATCIIWRKKSEAQLTYYNG